MTLPAAPSFSEDQAEAWDRLSAELAGQGIDLAEGLLTPAVEGSATVMAVVGKAGSGKTLLLAELYKALKAAGVEVVSGDYESRRRKDRRTLAILAPTNKAASVLRLRGVPATTIHRILYTPVYDPQYEKIAEWLSGQAPRPTVEGLTEQALDRAHAFYQTVASIPGALAAAGLRGSDFITGWKRREDPLDLGFVDEASMLDERQLDDLREIFPAWSCSATRRSWRRWASRGRWSSTGCRGAQAGAAPHPPAGRRQPDPRSGPCAGRRPAGVRGFRGAGAGKGAPR
jgi:exodeoxyribonuclease-5